MYWTTKREDPEASRVARPRDTDFDAQSGKGEDAPRLSLDLLPGGVRTDEEISSDFTWTRRSRPCMVLCVDEKSQIQALDGTQPMLPLVPGIAERRTHYPCMTDIVHGRASTGTC
jgi:hypothetical protein